jgi:hypothetical protein
MRLCQVCGVWNCGPSVVELDSRDEGGRHHCGGEAPLLVDCIGSATVCQARSVQHGTSLVVPLTRRERFEESEDQSIREPRQEGTPKHDGLRDKHDKRSRPGLDDLVGTEPVLAHLVRTVHVRLAVLPPPTGLAVEKHRGSCLRNEEVQDLDEPAEDELGPADPVPGQIGLNEWPDDGSDDATLGVDERRK